MDRNHSNFEMQQEGSGSIHPKGQEQGMPINEYLTGNDYDTDNHIPF
jgi:hypothetical protein